MFESWKSNSLTMIDFCGRFYKRHFGCANFGLAIIRQKERERERDQVLFSILAWHKASYCMHPVLQLTMYVYILPLVNVNFAMNQHYILWRRLLSARSCIEEEQWHDPSQLLLCTLPLLDRTNNASYVYHINVSPLSPSRRTIADHAMQYRMLLRKIHVCKQLRNTTKNEHVWFSGWGFESVSMMLVSLASCLVVAMS